MPCSGSKTHLRKPSAISRRCRETEINLPFIISTGKNQAYHLHRVVTRGKLEELTLDLTERTIEICRTTMEDAGLKPRDLAEVVLVGGMTRMPKVQELVAEFFGREPCKGVHPDEVVAMGAAIQGAALIDAAAAPDMLLLDVTPHSLGIMVAGGYFHRLIDRNTTVPTSKSHVFTTVRDDQTSVKIVVFQGESDRPRRTSCWVSSCSPACARRPRARWRWMSPSRSPPTVSWASRRRTWRPAPSSTSRSPPPAG